MKVVSETVTGKLTEETNVRVEERNAQDVCIKAVAKEEEMNRVESG